MDFEEFLKNQEEVYAKFGDQKKLREQGLVPNVSQIYGGGYLVSFRYPNDVTSRVDDLSRRVSAIIPSIEYNYDNIHTTLTNYHQGVGFSPNGNILDALSEASRTVRNRVRPPVVDFRRWLYNQDSLIAAGYPNDLFLEASKVLDDGVRKTGLRFKSAWGAHITANRFLEDVEPEKLEEFFRLVDSTSVPGTSQPFAIDVGYVSTSPEGFVYQVTDRVLF